MFQLILFIAFILALVFGEWVGEPFSWFLGKCVANPYGAIVITFLLLIAFIRLFNVFIGETTIRSLNLPRRQPKVKVKKEKEK